MRVAWLAGMAVAALLASPARGDEWSHRYPLTGRPDLQVKTDDGSVRIETHDAPEIAARVTTEGWRIAPGEVTITESQDGDRVHLEVRLPQSHFGFGWGHSHRSVEVVLQVPKEADLDVRTGDGSITLDKPVAVLGAVSPSKVRGKLGAGGQPLRIQTGDGPVRLVRP